MLSKLKLMLNNNASKMLKLITKGKGKGKDNKAQIFLNYTVKAQGVRNKLLLDW